MQICNTVEAQALLRPKPALERRVTAHARCRHREFETYHVPLLLFDFIAQGERVWRVSSNRLAKLERRQLIASQDAATA